MSRRLSRIEMRVYMRRYRKLHPAPARPNHVSTDRTLQFTVANELAFMKKLASRWGMAVTRQYARKILAGERTYGPGMDIEKLRAGVILLLQNLETEERELESKFMKVRSKDEHTKVRASR